VNRRLPFAKLLALLCLIALFGAQVCGGVRGYWCDSAGVTAWAVQDPCFASMNPQGEGDGDGEPVDHEQVRDDVQMRLLPALVAPVHVPMLIAVLDEDPVRSLACSFLARGANGHEAAGPPSGVAVARTIVLLI
jgi:hypothetical protein